MAVTVTVISMMQVTGYVGIYTAASAWYISFAELLNEIWFKGRVSLLQCLLSLSIQCIAVTWDGVLHCECTALSCAVGDFALLYTTLHKNSMYKP